MRKLYQDILVLASVAAMLAPGSAPGQSRKRVDFKRVRLTRPGESGVSHTFRNYSYGLGELRKAAPSPGENLLRSSISRPASFTLQRSGGSAVSALQQPGLTGGGMTYTPWAYSGSADRLLAPRKSAAETLSTMGLFAEASDLSASLELEKGGEPITSFVPDEPSEYQRYMQRGEKFFREEQFMQAFDQFKTATYLARDDVAGYLSMAHTQFATASYASAAFYLQQALRYMPDLALVRLRPKGFYGHEAKYNADLDRLTEYLEQVPQDGGAQLLRAYFLWFDQDVQGAIGSLKQAEAAVKDPKKDARLAEAVDIFSRGMQRSGLLAATQPAATTQPAEQDGGESQTAGEAAKAAAVPSPPRQQQDPTKQ